MRITASAAKELVHSGSEAAFLDVREAAAYGDGHPLFAVHCPYSQIEDRAARLVPRLDVPILLIDDGDGLAEKAARRLTGCGYRDVRFVDGGMPAWQAAGFGVFAGVNVPSKTLGELLEHDHHPRTITAEVLAGWEQEKLRFHFFDARPPAEIPKMRIAGARCLPNGELAHRLNAVVTDDETPIVVTCAGRTRGIVGALGLRAAGIRNPVYALENGTQGWALAGFPLERGAVAESLPELDPAGHAGSRARAAQLRQHGISFVTTAEAAAFLAQPDRTTFLFDLRAEDERRALPCPGAEPVLGGQLVQATDLYVGVRGARLVLVDDTGLRGALAALFLAALGFDPHVLALDDRSGPLPTGRTTAPQLPPPPPVSAEVAMQKLQQTDVALIDLRSSAEFEAAHLDGALWSIRPRLPADLVESTRSAVLFGPTHIVAAAALDLEENGIGAFWLNDSLEKCAAAGWRIAPGDRMTPDEAIDRVWFVHDRHDGNRAASLQYLAWETGLISQLDAQERAAFRDIRLPD